ncbi:MAG: hypothetical protein ACJ71N_13420 [Terriglobales bacterium]
MLQITVTELPEPTNVYLPSKLVSSQVMFGPGKGAAARNAALKEAGDFCGQQAKELLVDDYTSAGGANTITGDAEVRFRCLAKDDPELRRPAFQQTIKSQSERR